MYINQNYNDCFLLQYFMHFCIIFAFPVFPFKFSMPASIRIQLVNNESSGLDYILIH